MYTLFSNPSEPLFSIPSHPVSPLSPPPKPSHHVDLRPPHRRAMSTSIRNRRILHRDSSLHTRPSILDRAIGDVVHVNTDGYSVFSFSQEDDDEEMERNFNNEASISSDSTLVLEQPQPQPQTSPLVCEHPEQGDDDTPNPSTQHFCITHPSPIHPHNTPHPRNTTLHTPPHALHLTYAPVHPAPLRSHPPLPW
jgi:hypothetical protein